MTERIPESIGRYEIQECLGRGAMGIVYLAKDPSALKRLVAIKVLRVDDPDMRLRFEREAELIGQFRHSKLVSVYDVGDHEGQPFITMEYVPGETLAEKIRKQEPLTLERRLMMIEGLCDGLAYAHTRDVIHRDIKPANLIIDDDGELRILDFGIARGVASTGITELGMIIGTPRYMSPEQLDSPQVDHRSDIFAVGCVLYELLCYQAAFPGEQRDMVAHHIRTRSHTPLRQVDARLPRRLGAVVDRTLQKDPARRYQHLPELQTELQEIRSSLDTDTLSTTVLLPGRGPTPRRRVPWVAIGAAAAVVAAVGLWMAQGGQLFRPAAPSTTQTAAVLDPAGPPPAPAPPPPEQTAPPVQEPAQDAAWAAFQADMADANLERMTRDVDVQLTPAEKSDEWRAFLVAYADQNPLTEEDDRLRDYAETRVAFWDAQPAAAAADTAALAPPPEVDAGPDPAAIRAAVAQAQQLLGAGSYEAAAAAFDAVLALDPGNSTALAGLDRVRPPASPIAGQIWNMSPVDGREMRWVPPGAFLMGSPDTEPNRDPDEPQHPIQFASGYWVDAAEVTHLEFQHFIVANPAWSKDGIPSQLHDGNYLTNWSGTEFPAGKAVEPVVNVSWHAARAYAAWAGKRLPTEAEWEYPARAGAASAYWWGDGFEPQRAGSEPGAAANTRNAWGLADMIGGVWEWTTSGHGEYPYNADDGREAQVGPDQRVVRGGASVNSARMLRVANRNSDVPARSSDLVGFRCAR